MLVYKLCDCHLTDFGTEIISSSVYGQSIDLLLLLKLKRKLIRCTETREIQKERPNGGMNKMKTFYLGYLQRSGGYLLFILTSSAPC